MFQTAYNVLNHNQKGVTMKTLTINAENWTGEDENIKLYADGRRFKIGDRDETFRIVPKMNNTEGVDMLKDYNTYKVQYQHSGSHEWHDTDIKGEEHHRQTVGDRQLCPHHYEFKSYFGEYRRTSTKDPRLAAAKHLLMVF